MKPEEQRVALAKLRGWSVSATGWWSHPTLPDNGGSMYNPPDYLDDLNDANEAEESIKDWQKYTKMLAKVIAGCPDATRAGGTIVNCPNHILIRATAAKRSEAILRTLNLWKDEPNE